MAVLKIKNENGEWVEVLAIVRSIGAELPSQLLTLEGDCAFKFYKGKWDWVIQNYGERMSVGTITALTSFLYDSSVEELPFELNLTCNASGSNTTASVFCRALKLKRVPYIRGNITPSEYSSPNLVNFFGDCHELEYIPNDFFHVLADSEVYAPGTARRNQIFYNCYCLRTLPDISMLANGAQGSSSLYTQMCNGCYVLDEIVNVPILSDYEYRTTSTYSPANSCSRLKRFTFATDNGTPKTVQMKYATFDFTSYCGYSSTSSSSMPTNFGIPDGKRVTDEETYQSLKDDPDWWTSNNAYSRYNHDSAVETINSLPDTSAYLAEVGGTNTIKFRGVAGSLTDGGAINTLTEEEIAVATAKGWTVTLV